MSFSNGGKINMVAIPEMGMDGTIPGAVVGVASVLVEKYVTQLGGYGTPVLMIAGGMAIRNDTLKTLGGYTLGRMMVGSVGEVGTGGGSAVGYLG